MENPIRYFFRQLTLIMEDDMMSFAVHRKNKTAAEDRYE